MTCPAPTDDRSSFENSADDADFWSALGDGFERDLQPSRCVDLGRGAQNHQTGLHIGCFLATARGISSLSFRTPFDWTESLVKRHLTAHDEPADRSAARKFRR